MFLKTHCRKNSTSQRKNGVKNNVEYTKIFIQSIYRQIINWYGLFLIIGKTAIMKLLEIILAILLPPVGVFMRYGLSGTFWINLLLTILGYIPGIIHALIVLMK